MPVSYARDVEIDSDWQQPEIAWDLVRVLSIVHQEIARMCAGLADSCVTCVHVAITQPGTRMTYLMVLSTPTISESFR